MKKILFTIATVATMCACNNAESSVKIDEQNAMNLAYDLSYELCTKITKATTYEEFQSACAELRAYDEAFRTQIGGEEYLIFIEECNLLLSEI